MLDNNGYGQSFLKDGTLGWPEEQLKLAQEENASVIAVCHQNLYAHNPLPSFGYQLYNYSDLLELFENTARNQVFSTFAESTLSQQEQTTLAKTFAQINSAYFAGENRDFSAPERDIQLWRNQEDSFCPILNPCWQHPTENGKLLRFLSNNPLTPKKQTSLERPVCFPLLVGIPSISDMR